MTVGTLAGTRPIQKADLALLLWEWYAHEARVALGAEPMPVSWRR